MLQTLSSTATAAARPKFMTRVFDKKSGSTSDKVTPKKSKGKKDPSAPGKPCSVLFTNCYQLNLPATTVEVSVQLHLTSYYEILVLKRLGDNSNSESAFRRHSVIEDTIREHQLLSNVLEVVCGSNGSVYAYQMEKHKTLKQWLSKIKTLKEEATEQLNSCIVNGGVHQGDEWKINGKKESISLKGSPELPKASFSSSYSQGPGSPVQQRAIDSRLAIPGGPTKRKSRTLERVSKGGKKIGSLLRRSTTDSQIEISPEELELLTLQGQSVTSRSSGHCNPGRMGKKYLSTGSLSLLDADSTGSSPTSSRILVNGSDTLLPLCDTLNNVIMEEEGPEGVVLGDISDDSDLPSGPFSCTSSRCSSTRSYGKQDMAESASSVSDRVTSMQERGSSVAGVPVTSACSPQEDVCNEILVIEDDRRHSGIVRRASEQVMGLLQMRSLRERRLRRRSEVYVRSCYSTSDLDHVTYDTNMIDHLHQPTNQDVLQHQTTPTLPECMPELGSQSRLTTPTSTTMATSPTPSQNSESDNNGEDFAVSRFHHVQIRRHRWKQSPRIQSPRIQSPLHPGTGICRTESYQSEKSEVGGATGGSGNRSLSVSPTSQITVDQWSTRSDTPSEVFDNDSAIHGYNRLSSTPGHASSSTLPRIKKDRMRMSSEAGGSGKGSAILTKSPKISRLFHKRQSSSASLGKILDLKYDSNNISSSETTPCSSFPDHTPFNKFHLFPPKDVAMELSLVDSELMRQIRPEEIKDAAWTKKATKELLAPNVLAMVRAFNQLALLVPTEILAETTPQARAKVITSYIRIAARCRALHNYNSLKAVLAGLQCTPIYRLTRTWKMVPSRRKKLFDQLCLLMSEDENWRCYRDKIQRHLVNRTPFIPFLGMFLTQVIQMESFLSIKRSTGSKEKETELSKSYSEESSISMQPSMFNHTDVDPVTLEKRRRRSASLGEHSFYPQDSPPREGVEPGEDHTPVFTANNSMEHNGADSLSEIDGSTYDDPFPAENPGISHCSTSNEEQLEDPEEFDFNVIANDKIINSSHSSNTDSDSDHTHMTPPTMNGITVPSVEIGMYSSQESPSKNMCLKNGMKLAKSCETNSEFDVDSQMDQQVVRRNKRDALSLTDISVGFKHRSMSLESLLKAYKENRLSLFKMGDRRLSKYNDNYGSFEESDDEDEEEEEEDDDLVRSGRQEEVEEDGLESSMCSVLSETLSDIDLTGSTINSSFNTSLLRKEEEEEEDEEGGQSLNTSYSEAQNDNCAETSNILRLSDSEEFKSSTPMPDRSKGGGAGRSKVKRTNSQNSKGTLRRNRMNLLRKPKSFVYAVDDVDISTGSPEDILLKLQTATLGCGLGTTPRAALRRVLQDSVPNSELENHKLSLHRELNN